MLSLNRLVFELEHVSSKVVSVPFFLNGQEFVLKVTSSLFIDVPLRLEDPVTRIEGPLEVKINVGVVFVNLVDPDWARDVDEAELVVSELEHHILVVEVD